MTVVKIQINDKKIRQPLKILNVSNQLSNIIEIYGEECDINGTIVSQRLKENKIWAKIKNK